MLLGDPPASLELLPFPVSLDLPASRFLWPPEASSLTRLIGALPTACTLPAPFDRDGVLLQEGGRVPRPATLLRGLGKELGLLEPPLDKLWTFNPVDLAARELLHLTGSVLLVAEKTPGGTWEEKPHMELEAGTPSLGADWLDRLLVAEEGALHSVDIPDPAEV